jgi:hypothetical protein
MSEQPPADLSNFFRWTGRSKSQKRTHVPSPLFDDSILDEPIRGLYDSFGWKHHTFSLQNNPFGAMGDLTGALIADLLQVSRAQASMLLRHARHLVAHKYAGEMEELETNPKTWPTDEIFALFSISNIGSTLIKIWQSALQIPQDHTEVPVVFFYILYRICCDVEKSRKSQKRRTKRKLEQDVASCSKLAKREKTSQNDALGAANSSSLSGSKRQPWNSDLVLNFRLLTNNGTIQDRFAIELNLLMEGNSGIDDIKVFKIEEYLESKFGHAGKLRLPDDGGSYMALSGSDFHTLLVVGRIQQGLLIQFDYYVENLEP